MIEIRGDKKVLITPVSAEDLNDIRIGDIVWLKYFSNKYSIGKVHLLLYNCFFAN